MCAEKDPLACHRTILVCRHLISQGLIVNHILDNGQLESHEAALIRLLCELKIPDTDLFRSREELHAEAYAKRGQQIAYFEKDEVADETEVGIQQ